MFPSPCHGVVSGTEFMKYIRYNGTLAQIPDVQHDTAIQEIIDNALELSWSDYLWFVKQNQKKIKLKSTPNEIEFYIRRTDKEIKNSSNINGSIEEIKSRIEYDRKYAIKYNKRFPEKAINRRLLAKMKKNVDNFVDE